MLAARGWHVGAALMVALAVGCTSSDGADANGESHDEQTDEQATEPEAVGPQGTLQLTGWAQEHRAMVTVALRRVTVDDAGDLLLGMEAVNRGFRGESRVSVGEFGVRVRDDLGNSYDLRAPEDNGRLRFAADERLLAALAFDGPVDPDARRLEIGFNQRGDEAIPAAEDRISQYPKFLFDDVPLPGVGLEAEADRGADGSLIEERTVELDETADIDHLDGLEVTLVDYTTDDQTHRFTLEARNQTDRPVELASANPVLDDGHGSQFVFERADDDRDQRVIRLEPGDEASATVAFRGTASPEAEHLTLMFNRGTRDRDSPTNPYVEFSEIPRSNDAG